MMTNLFREEHRFTEDITRIQHPAKHMDYFMLNRKPWIHNKLFNIIKKMFLSTKQTCMLNFFIVWRKRNSAGQSIILRYSQVDNTNDMSIIFIVPGGNVRDYPLYLVRICICTRRNMHENERLRNMLWTFNDI